MKHVLMTAGLLAAAALSSAAGAAPIALNQWYTFQFAETGSAIGEGILVTLGENPDSVRAPAAPWTIDLARAGFLTVVDGFDGGDRFSLSDGGTLLGETSAASQRVSCGRDITLCLATPGISKGVFALAAGSHSITGTAIASPFGAGAGFFQIAEAVVPEPATWAMMIGGFGLAGGALRRRRAVRTTVRFA